MGEIAPWWQILAAQVLCLEEFSGLRKYTNQSVVTGGFFFCCCSSPRDLKRATLNKNNNKFYETRAPELEEKTSPRRDCAICRPPSEPEP